MSSNSSKEKFNCIQYHRLLVLLVYFSIIIYSYDRKDYIMEAVLSAVQQNFDRSSFEIIVVKGFEDAAIDLELQASGVKNIFLDEKSLGKKVARGIEESTGEFICLLDDDDKFEPDKLSSLQRIISGAPDVDFVHNSLTRIGEHGNTMDWNSTENVRKIISYSPTNDECSSLSEVMRHRGDWYLSAMSIRKSVMQRVMSDLENTYQSIDKFIFFSALNYGRRILMVPDKLTRYRMHQSTTTYGGHISNFISRRVIFFKNTVRIFENIVRISKGLPGEEFAMCQLLQHKINLFFISDDPIDGVSMKEFVRFLECFKLARSRYQFAWAIAFFVRRFLPRISTKLYYIFMKKALSPSTLA